MSSVLVTGTWYYPSRPGAQPARHRAHPELLPGGARPYGAAVRHAPEPAAAAHTPGGRQEGLASIEAANRWLATVYIPHHNARFAVARAEEGTAFVPFVGALDDILCVQEARVVGNDNTVRYAGRVLQIPEQRHRRHFVKANVRVHEHPDGRLAIFHGPRRLADYEADGSLIDQIRLVQTAA